MSFASPNPFRAIGLKLASILIFVVMAALIKAASEEVPPGEAVFFRAFFATPVIVTWLALRGELRRGLKTKRPWAHVRRGIAGTLAMGAGFAGLALLPLSEVQAIQYATPLFVVVLAALVLGEVVRKVRLTAVGLGMVGVLVILWPRLGAFVDGSLDPNHALGAMIVLAGTLAAATAQVLVRRMVETEETAAIVFWFSLTASGLALLTAPFGWAVPTPLTAAMLVAAGLFGGAGQILLTSAYRYGDASIIAPFEYASILFAIAIGFFFFGEVPTVTTLYGAAIVIAAGVLIILRERHLRIQRGKARRFVTPNG